MQQQEKNLPIGYWLQKASTLLTDKISKAHESVHLSRLDWQIMHTIQQKGNIPVPEVLQAVAVFAINQELQETLQQLVNRNLIAYTEENWELVCLTANGTLVHQESLQRQLQIRQKAMLGISETEYLVVIQTLQKLISNLEDL